MAVAPWPWWRCNNNDDKKNNSNENKNNSNDEFLLFDRC